MTKYLFVGDPHAQHHDLRDCKALADFILRVGAEGKHDALILAGDLYDTHAIIHAEVQWFWRQFLAQAADVFDDIYVIKGNHDAPGTVGTGACALWAHFDQENVTVVMAPVLVGRVLFCPYAADPNQLVTWAKDDAELADVLFCHQTFDGSRYDNGFYAGDGVDPELIPQETVISGHIHLPQLFGKVWYPGAPRWRHLSDANIERAIWTLEIEGGKVVSKTPHLTGGVCRRIWQFEDRVDAPADANKVFDSKDTVHVEVVGPKDWIDARRPLWEGRARVQTVRTDIKAQIQVRESEGLGVAFDKWVDGFQAPRGTDSATLRQMARERVRVAV